MSDAIVIRGVTKTFGPKVAVSDLDLVVPQGSLCGFLGRNGAGKTTTIRMVMSIIFPDRGEITVLGKKSAIESKDQIGYLPEERGVYRKMKVGAFLTYLGRLKGVDGSVLTRLIKEWLDRVDLANTYNKKCEELSKGMQQKVQFVGSILHRPELIILDEPFSGLDPVNSRLMRDLIDQQHAEGRTIIFSTHQMWTAEQICDKLFMIDNGRKVLDSTVREVLSNFDPHALLFEPLETPADADAAFRVLEQVRAVSGVDRVQNKDNGTFEIALNQRAVIPNIMAALASAVPSRRIEVKRANLEDVFIQIVEQSQQAGARGAAA